MYTMYNIYSFTMSLTDANSNFEYKNARIDGILLQILQYMSHGVQPNKKLPYQGRKMN